MNTGGNSDTVEEKVLALLSIMKNMPSGLFDRRAAHKLNAELREFNSAGWPDKLAEAADVAYYTSKLVCYVSSIESRNCAYWTVLFWQAVHDAESREGTPGVVSDFQSDIVAIIIERALFVVLSVEHIINVRPGASLDLAIAKYKLRSRPGNPKDHAAEIAACLEVFNAAKK